MTYDYRKEKETAIIDAPFTGKFEDIISQLQDWKNEGNWEGVEIEYDYENGNSYQLYKHCEETDKEYDKRMRLLEKEKSEKIKAKERRRKEYEKLRKEFEDTP